jgi:hypothetical protein
MAGRPKSVTNTKVFDVAKPGKATPVGTSRPVIINHAAAVKDATVLPEPGSENEAPKSPPSVTRRVISPVTMGATDVPAEPPKTSSITILDEPKKADPKKSTEIVPVSAPEVKEEVQKTEDTTEPVQATEQAEPEPEAAQAPEPRNDTPTDDTEVPASDNEAEKPVQEVENPEPEPSEPAEAETVETSSEAAGVDALAEASTKGKEEQKAIEEQAKRDAALQGLIDSKKYVVPVAHDSGQQRSGTGALMILLLIILLAIGAYVAIDAKLIDTGINLPYHIFQQ